MVVKGIRNISLALVYSTRDVRTHTYPNAKNDQEAMRFMFTSRLLLDALEKLTEQPDNFYKLEDDPDRLVIETLVLD